MSWNKEQCEMWRDWAIERYKIEEEELQALKEYAAAYKKS